MYVNSRPKAFGLPAKAGLIFGVQQQCCRKKLVKKL